MDNLELAKNYDKLGEKQSIVISRGLKRNSNFRWFGLNERKEVILQ